LESSDHYSELCKKVIISPVKQSFLLFSSKIFLTGLFRGRNYLYRGIFLTGLHRRATALPTTSAEYGSLTMGNMMLVAHALGLGSCWINRTGEEFDSDEGKAILREPGIEGEGEGIGHCIWRPLAGTTP
jgi:hypothetical protein